MVKRTGDTEPEPPGGRAAERLRQFERARGCDPADPSQGTEQSPDSPAPQRVGADEEE